MAQFRSATQFSQALSAPYWGVSHLNRSIELNETTILTDWKFWSLIISILALLLSQLPPLHLLFRKPKIDFEAYSKFFITQKVGNPNIQSHLIIRNTGGRRVRVKKITAKVLRDGKPIIELPAQNYIPDVKDSRFVLLTSFDIEPNDEWRYQISFLRGFERKVEKEYRDSEILLRHEIHRVSQLEENKGKTLFEANESFSTPFEEIFNDLFIWEPGEYEIEISIKTDTPSADLSKKFRLTIFESISEDLKKHVKGFKSGAGVYWDSPLYTGYWVDVSEVDG